MDDLVRLLQRVGRQEAVVLRLNQLMSKEGQEQLLAFWLLPLDKKFIEEYVERLTQESQLFKVAPKELRLYIYQLVFQYHVNKSFHRHLPTIALPL